MARRLVWMAVVPRVTVSEALNLRGRAGRAGAVRAKAEGWIQAAPAAQAVRWMKSRRFIWPPADAFPGLSTPQWTREGGDRFARGAKRPKGRRSVRHSRGIARPRPTC